GHGTKVYFATPVRGRDVLAGKNLVSGTMAVAQMIVIAIVFHFMVTPVTLRAGVDAALVVSIALLLLLTAGNFVSILFPHPASLERVSGSSSSGIQTVMNVFSIVPILLVVAAGPVAGRVLQSDAITYGTLAVELGC